MKLLSKREKVLLYIAFLLVFSYLGYIKICHPVRAQLKELEAQAAWSGQTQKSLDFGFERLVETKRLKEYFVAEMSNVALEKFLIDYMDQYDIIPSATQISVERDEEIRVLIADIQAFGSLEDGIDLICAINQHPAFRIETFSIDKGGDPEFYQVSAQIRCLMLKDKQEQSNENVQE